MKIKIIDNFFKDKDLKLIQKFTLKKKVQKDGIEVYHNKIDKNYNVESDIFDKETLKKLHKSYHSIAMNILEELSPEKKTFIRIFRISYCRNWKRFHFSNT